MTTSMSYRWYLITATPMANGTKTNEPEMMAFWRLLPRFFELTIDGTTDPAIAATTSRAVAYTNHLICSRSNECARRKRTTSETTETRAIGKIRPNASLITLKTLPSGPLTPSGLIEWLPSITPG